MSSPDSGQRWRAAIWSGVGFPLGFIVGTMTVGGVTGGLVGGVVGAGVVFGSAFGLSQLAGRAAAGVVMPSGRSTPYEEAFSREDALVMRGDVAGAIASFEARLQAEPSLAPAWRRLADLHARPGGDPGRAAECYRRLRAVPAVRDGDALYATQRLVDLHLGPLGDRGRALVELRRLAESWPSSREASFARNAIARLKAEAADG